MSKNAFTVGTDQELFLISKGNFVSSIGRIEGTKEAPKPLPSGGSIQRDNVAVEFATPPVSGEKKFISTIKTSLREMLALVPHDCEAEAISSTLFPESELDNLEAQQFGCDPDYCAWALTVNPPPDSGDATFRSCGGHLHVGYTDGSGNDFLLDPMGKVYTIRAFDIFLGIPFTVLDSSEAAVQRRKLYGRAGCHRPTSYGVEYRTLSNYWMCSPDLVKLVHRLATVSLKAIRTETFEDLSKKIGSDTIQDVINTGNQSKALQIWESMIKNKISVSTRKLFNICKNMEQINLKTAWDL